MSVGTEFAAWLTAEARSTRAVDVRSRDVEAFLAQLTERVSAATVAKYYRSLQQLFRWLEEDDEIERSPMGKMHPPHVPEQPVPVLSLDDLMRLFATCKGNTFENRRSPAILRLLIDTGMRAAEIAGLRLEDVDQEQQTAIVMGKGGRARACPYGAKTADCLRRYLRARRAHQHAHMEWLWVGKQGRFTDTGMRQMLDRRTADAGLGCRTGARSRTLCGWPGGSRERWSVATPRRPLTVAPWRRTAVWGSETRCKCCA